jgi:hypothetical protein
MRRRIWLAAIAAAGLAGCGGSLVTPDAPVVDRGVFVLPDAGWSGTGDAAPLDGPGMNPCPDKRAERVDGAACQFSIPDAAACTGIGIRVHVMIDGTEVPRLPDDGWTFIDATETSIELHGTACERASQSPTGVTIYFTFYLP